MGGPTAHQTLRPRRWFQPPLLSAQQLAQPCPGLQLSRRVHTRRSTVKFAQYFLQQVFATDLDNIINAARLVAKTVGFTTTTVTPAD